MLEFLVAENGEPEGDDIRLRMRNPSSFDVEQALRSPDDVWYGTHYLLRGDGINIVAISTTGPFMKAEDPGEFLLYSGGHLTKERAARDEVVSVFLAALV
jgi:hypothetical protein